MDYGAIGLISGPRPGGCVLCTDRACERCPGTDNTFAYFSAKFDRCGIKMTHFRDQIPKYRRGGRACKS